MKVGLKILQNAKQLQLNLLKMSSPSKLFSCVQSAEICNSPLNLSPAKQQFSFPKTQRFKVPLPYCDNIYNLPSMKMTRHTNLGVGKKTDLDYGKHRHNITPSPDLYKIQSFADLNQQHQNGSTIHIGRGMTTPRSYIVLDQIKVPGPGRYDELRFNSSPKWTMRPIVDQDLFGRTTQKIVPGSDVYNFSQKLNPEGKYYVSKYRGSKSKVWNPKSSERFNKSSTDVPGAGKYNPINDLNDSGKYVLSKDTGRGCRKLDNEFRASFVDLSAKITKTPGPGSYRLSSEFGQYDEIQKTLQE